MKYVSPQTLLKALAFQVSFIGLFTCLSGQTSEFEDEDVYELSPFTVTTDKDDRYYASNSISATELDVPIKDIPFSIEVITSEFIQDTGADDFKEFLAFSSGVYTESYVDNSGVFSGSGDRSPSSQARVGDPTTNAIIIRGYTAPFQNRMGFRVGSQIGLRGGSAGQGSSGRGAVTLGSLIDAINVDRSEVVRGPASLLYGLGVVSGIVNVLPKQPLDYFRTEIKLTAGNYDYLRGTLDTTGPVMKNKEGDTVLSYRLLAAWQENGDWIDYTEEKKNYQAFQLSWKPTRNLEIFTEVSRGKVRMDGYQQGNYLRDDRSRSSWASPGATVDDSIEFVNAYGENYRWGEEDFAGPFPDAWSDVWWADSGVDVPTSGQNVKDEPLNMAGRVNPPSFNIFGPDTYYKRNEESALLDVKWTVNRNLSFKFGGFLTRQESERRSVTAHIIHDQWGNLKLVDSILNKGILTEDEIFTVWNPSHDPLNADSKLETHRAIGYYWSESPSDASSRQWRASGVYTFETPFLGGDAEHSILVGTQHIRDKANLWIGTDVIDQDASDLWWNEAGNPRETYEEGAVRVRSFYGWQQPLRYEGQRMLIPQGTDHDYTVTLWYQGYYAIYSGKYMNDRLTVIAGWRNDSYQAKEQRWRHDWNDPERKPYIPSDPDEQNPYYNFVDANGNEKPFRKDTLSLGLNYKLTDIISLYFVSAQGVLPNTGQRDGSYNSIEPETSQSYEIGVKFDVNQKLSGSIGVFKIKKENAIWSYGNAPNPSRWQGGLDPFRGGTNAAPGEAHAAGVPLNYGFNYHLYFKPLIDGENGEYWMKKLGIVKRIELDVRNNSDQPLTNGVFDPAKTPNPETGIVHISRKGSINKEQSELTDDFRPFVFISYEVLDPANEEGKFDPELYAIAQQAMEDYRTGNHPQGVPPLGYGTGANSGAGKYIGANASARVGGTSVTFEEEATGFDVQMIYSPTRSLQFTFNFSHVKREAVSGFNLVPAVDQTYTQLGPLSTEFDIWVADFGEEAFTDASDPTTMTGGIKGKSLYYGAENSASVWGRYTFRDGPLEGFGVGLGVIYQGPTQTSVPIGGNGSEENRYPTPDMEARIETRAAFYYTREFDDFTMKLQLNIDNLTNNKRLYSEKAYPGTTEVRRSERYLDPISWRFSCSIIF